MDTREARAMNMKMMGVALAFLFVGVGVRAGGEDIIRGAWLRATREYREKILLRTIGEDLPFAVLDEIRDAREDVPSILAMVMLESSGRPKAHVLDDEGHVVAYGAMGVRPQHATARGYSVEDLANPVLNVRIGIEVLKEIRTRWPGEMESTSVYHAGDVAWKRAIELKQSPGPKTVRYWAEFQRLRDEYRGWIEREKGLE